MSDLARLTADLARRLEASDIVAIDVSQPADTPLPESPSGALLFCEGLLEHSPDPVRLLAVLSEHLAEASAALVSIADREISEGEEGGGAARFNAAELVALAEDAGLEVAWLGLTDAAGSLGRRAGITCAVSRTRADDVREALTGGALGLAFDPAASGAARTRAPRVCIVSYEFVGPTRTGGIGTAYTSLAETLAAAGQDVTLLFSGWEEPGGEPFRHWVEHYRKLGIVLERLPQPTANWIETGHRHAVRAYEVHRWLRERDGDFDVVHFPEVLGHGYYAICAKRLGIAFATTTLAVGTHSSTSWVLETNGTLYQAIDDFADDFIERRCVSDCDALISPSAYMLDWMRARGWTLPHRHFVQQYAHSHALAAAADTGRSHPGRDRSESRDEIVFFGRMEPRKGLRVFCDALDQLAADQPPSFRITFLGKQSTINGVPAAQYVTERARKWPWDPQVIDGLGQPEAVAYLRARGGRRRVTVIPSLADNSPNTVYEALGLRIPFVASRVGGTAELIDPRDIATATFDPKGDRLLEAPEGARALADRLRSALSAPELEAPRPSVSADAGRHAHVHWHATVEPEPAPRVDLPEVSTVGICVVGEGSERRAATLDSISAQTRAPAEAISAASHGAAKPSAGLVFFVPAGGRLAPEAVETLERAAAASGAELIAVPVSFVAPGTQHEVTRVPVGGPLTAGLLRRGLGDAVFAIRRERLERLGGADSDVEPADQAHHLLCRAAIAGVRIEVLPEPLVRGAPADALGKMEIVDASRAHTGVLKAFAEAPAGALTDLPRLTQQLAAAAIEREREFVRLYEHRFGRLTLPIRRTAFRVRRARALIRRRRR